LLAFLTLTIFFVIFQTLARSQFYIKGPMIKYPEKVLALAERFVNAKVPYDFSELETRALRPFFTNTDRKVFFLQGLPANVGASLMAMFSRIKNQRGLRGVFVDAFLPQFLASLLAETAEKFNGNAERFLKENKIKDLGTFAGHSRECKEKLELLILAATNFSEFLAKLSQTKNTEEFLSRWLDTFGHKSIGRMGSLWLCCEGVSLLTAKSLEWGRPGIGFIELSTRYVDMSGKDCYPVELELEAGWGIDPDDILKENAFLFKLYCNLAGQKFDGMLPNYMRNKYGELFTDSPKSLELGIVGETCDVLGNLLPASTLTSVGINMSGESFSQLLKHLILDNTPENLALAEAILNESKKIGGNQFATHFQPTPWEKSGWQYPVVAHFKDIADKAPAIKYYWNNGPSGSRPSIFDLDIFDPGKIRIKVGKFAHMARHKFDKLPREFEVITLPFYGVMSFRSWRDLQRQGLCTHMRTLITPKLGFYTYDKFLKDSPYPAFLYDAFDGAHKSGIGIYRTLREKDVPPVMKQYPLAIGNNIGFVLAGNLRQLEFCNWQRTKPSVNHEVRQIFMGIENGIRQLIPGWAQISRADMTPAFVFARGEKVIPLNLK
jgi:thymidylate synthase ThyX